MAIRSKCDTDVDVVFELSSSPFGRSVRYTRRHALGRFALAAAPGTGTQWKRLRSSENSSPSLPPMSQAIAGSWKSTRKERWRPYRPSASLPMVLSRGTTAEFAGPPATAFWPRSAARLAAVQCAVDIQNELAHSNNDLEKDRRMQFRIGINVGDVMLKDGDIFGDGVNIAARLEGLADPGGICISRGIHDHVMKKLPFEFEDLGEQSVKNIAQPVRVYRLRPGRARARVAIEPSCDAVARCRGRYSLAF